MTTCTVKQFVRLNDDETRNKKELFSPTNWSNWVNRECAEQLIIPLASATQIATGVK